MKKNQLLVLALVALLLASAGLSAQTVKPELKKVKVFPQGAEMVHSGTVDLKKGTHDIVIEGIADQVDPMSLRAGISGDGVMILSIGNIKNFIEEREDTREIRRLKDSLDRLKELLDESAIDRDALNAELELIMSSKNPNVKTATMSVAENVKELAAFYSERIPGIRKELLKINRYETKLQKSAANISQQIADYNNENRPVNQLVISVKSEKNTKATLSLSYYTSAASWYPFYDLRAGKKHEPVKIDAKAFVRQRTGMEWSGVELVLSNRSVNSFSQMQKAHQIFTYFKKERSMDRVGSLPNDKASVNVLSNTARMGAAQQSDYSASTESAPEDLSAEADFSVASGFSSNVSSDLFVEFTATEDYSIPSDGKEKVVIIGNYDVEAEYEYYCAPKLSLEAFIVARLRNFSRFHLLPGNANIFYDNTFIGKSRIDPQITDSVLQVSLGTDPGVVITRELRKDFSEEKFLSSNVERKFCFVNTIRNSKSEDVSITVEDMIPVSKDENIIVDPIDVGWGRLNKETGIITKKATIGAGSKVDFQTIYSIKYPNGRTVVNPY